MATEAKLIGVDSVMSGDWLGKRGRAGWSMNPNGTAATGSVKRVPPWLSAINILQGNSFLYADEGRTTAPWMPDGSERTRRVFTHASLVRFGLDAIGDATYLLSLYAYEYTNTGRTIALTIKSAIGAPALASATVAPPGLYNTGYWVVFACRGSVVVEAAQTVGPNVILGALVLDPWPLGFAGLSPGFVGHGVF